MQDHLVLVGMGKDRFLKGREVEMGIRDDVPLVLGWDSAKPNLFHRLCLLAFLWMGILLLTHYLST